MKRLKAPGIFLALLLSQGVGLVLLVPALHATARSLRHQAPDILFAQVLEGVLPGYPETGWLEGLAAVLSLGISGALPVLALRRLLPEGQRGQKAAVLGLAAAWAVPVTFFWLVNRFWFHRWEALAWGWVSAGRTWTSEEGLEVSLLGAALLIGAFLAWPAGWTLQLHAKLPGEVLRKALAGWGRRALRAAPLVVGVLVLLSGVLYGYQVERAKVAGAVFAAQARAAWNGSSSWTNRITGKTYLGWLCGQWECAPWYGAWDAGIRGWLPRRSSWECLKLLTGQDLPNDPEAWAAWLEAHPDLVWDPARGRFVEPPTAPQ